MQVQVQVQQEEKYDILGWFESSIYDDIIKMNYSILHQF